MMILRYCLAYVALTSTLSGQLFGPTEQQQPTQQQPAEASSQTTVVQRAPEDDSKKDGGFLGGDIPFFDPGGELVAWDGHTWNIANNRIFGARFEKYLSAPEAVSEEDQEYRETLDRILEELSPHQKGKANLNKAVALLPTAADYYNDARLCESLSNAIYGVWLARRNVSNLRAANKELEKELDRIAWNAKMEAKGSPLARNTSESSSGPETERDRREAIFEDEVRRTTQLGRYLKQAAEYEAMAMKNKAAMGASEIGQKLEFQGLIVQFFLQRRFEHVIIASRIYRQLFNDGDNAIQLEENSEAYRVFQTGLGVNPTITTLDAFANEAIRDVDEGVQAFLHLLEQDELEGATKRLTEAFAVGEYLPRIRTLSLDKKRKVLTFVRQSNQLLSALEVKDFETAEALVEQMKSEAKDFDYIKAQAAIRSNVTTANMFLDRAMLAARNGDDQAMQENLQKAHELYPMNPELEKVSDLIVKGSDVQGQALNDFDRLIAEGNYRAIQKDQARFAAAAGLSNDPKRVEQLQQVGAELKDLETRMEKARTLSENGAVEAAWETLEEVGDKFRHDAEFSHLKSDLTRRAAGFVEMISEAQMQEERGQQGSALAWYLKARQTFSGSSLARKGIDRIVNEMLPDDPSLSTRLDEQE